jgi:hypothetical protein
MVRAAMPEASVNRDRDPSRTEDDVHGPSWCTRNDMSMKPEAEAAPMELGAQQNLGRGVRTWLARELTRYGGRKRRDSDLSNDHLDTLPGRLRINLVPKEVFRILDFGRVQFWKVHGFVDGVA